MTEKNWILRRCNPRVRFFLTLQKLSLPRFFLLIIASQCTALQYITLQCVGKEGTTPVIELFPDSDKHHQHMPWCPS